LVELVAYGVVANDVLMVFEVTSGTWSEWAGGTVTGGGTVPIVGFGAAEIDAVERSISTGAQSRRPFWRLQPCGPTRVMRPILRLAAPLSPSLASDAAFFNALLGHFQVHQLVVRDVVGDVIVGPVSGQPFL
jgi:hypothetical protein